MLTGLQQCQIIYHFAEAAGASMLRLTIEASGL